VPRVAEVMRGEGAEVRVFALCLRDGLALPALREAGLDPVVRDGGRSDHRRALAWLDDAVVRYRPTHLWTSLMRATALGQIVGLRRGLPVASWQHASRNGPANTLLLRSSWRLSDLWVADSQTVAGYARTVLGVDPGRLVTWPIFAAEPAPRPPSRPTPGGTLRIVSLGRLHAVKGYAFLLRALAAARDAGMPPFELAIGGEGPERDALASQAKAMGLKLELPGFVAPAELLSTGHLYVQPSLSEGFCIAAHEALAAGLPVIASSVGEIARTIGEVRCGVTVPPRDVAALAAAIRALAGGAGDLARLGDRGLRHVRDRFGPAAFGAAGSAAVARLSAIPGNGARGRRTATTLVARSPAE
jgi:glycosyltransferase involved in cell wall biosynthesis